MLQNLFAVRFGDGNLRAIDNEKIIVDIWHIAQVDDIRAVAHDEPLRVEPLHHVGEPPADVVIPLGGVINQIVVKYFDIDNIVGG